MRRLARRLFALCSAVSLLLCVAVCVVWVRGYAAEDALHWGWDQGTRYNHFVEVGSARGQLGVFYGRPQVPPPTPVALRFRFLSYSFHQPLESGIPFGGRRRKLAGFLYWYGEPSASRVTAVFWPCWFAVVITSLAPAGWCVSCLGRCRRRRRSDRGRCTSCGYDLRATPGRCPECGTPAASPAAPPG